MKNENLLNERIEEFRELIKKVIEAMYDKKEVKDFVLNEILEPVEDEIFDDWESYCRMDIEVFERKIHDLLYDQIHACYQLFSKYGINRKDLMKYSIDLFRGFSGISNCVFFFNPITESKVKKRVNITQT